MGRLWRRRDGYLGKGVGLGMEEVTEMTEVPVELRHYDRPGEVGALLKSDNW